MLSLRTARRTVALINVLCEREEDASALTFVSELLLEHGELSPLDLTVADLADLRAAALQLREVFAATDADTAAATLNGLLSGAPGRLRLTSHDGASGWHPHLDSDDEAPWGEWFLASSTLALTVLLWDRQEPPGGLCASPPCPHVYLAHGSGPERRYCSRRCATRERVAAHRRAREPERG
ncbi:CGNR zinc finger domain-containing protein [Streptomyces sp. NBC_00237]|uniref:CGNR zinc finger domain-containing protein n=1 Tax=Streptomyces sp. NBC_00237 TaxID=2975687 RepID=UPI0022516D86|nr:CGNR zinc finger domain-containing protein [Streptomyces sp. NBC_00237]MCX5203399.1 CGNR zinc finger domain-containing protein [Streptomyces sp. NBC_00237]